MVSKRMTVQVFVQRLCHVAMMISRGRIAWSKGQFLETPGFIKGIVF